MFLQIVVLNVWQAALFSILYDMEAGSYEIWKVARRGEYYVQQNNRDGREAAGFYSLKKHLVFTVI